MNPKYIIGVPEMDAQHETLLNLAEKAANIDATDEFAMNSIVMELINYANSHLDQEEEFLKKNGLVEFEKEHSKKHFAFRDKAMEIYDSFRDAPDVESKAQLLKVIVTFCQKWLIQHINVEDREYGKLLHQKKVS